ncbi:MAG: B12 binding domain / kinase domain / Methylmalonyl-CoA mutase, partial [uncultured Actinomycetospora sp.]
LQRYGRRVLGDRPRRPAHLGRRDAGPLRRQRALPEAEVPRADLGPVAARAGDELQRHPHDPAGAVRALRQRELPAHQRLRRGRDHPVAGVGAPCAGDPADHQPRVGPVDEREPAAGLVRHRRADRPRRGGRADGVRLDRRARRRAGRHGDRLPARPDPGRVDALRVAQARRHAAARRRQHVPAARRRRAGGAGARPLPRHGGGEAGAAAAGGRFPVPPRGLRSGGPAAPAGRRHLGRQRLRRADGSGARVHPGAAHRRVLRGRRAVPALDV